MEADEEGPVILVDGWGDASVILVDGWGDVDDVGCSLVERWCDEDGVGGCAADVSTYKITSSLLSPINYFTYDLNVKLSTQVTSFRVSADLVSCFLNTNFSSLHLILYICCNNCHYNSYFPTIMETVSISVILHYQLK